MVSIEESNSIFLSDMKGSKLPIVVSHGEGRAYLNEVDYINLENNKQICMNYINDEGFSTDIYPFNPNGH